MTCEQWDVVVVPFPFTDIDSSKRRPALVLSVSDFNHQGHTVMAMITTSSHTPWRGDTPINHEAAGLSAPSTVRLKLFTLDNRLVVRKIGQLAPQDQRSVGAELERWLGIGES